METPRARAPETFPKPQAFARSACCFPLPGASGGARIAGLLKQLAAVRHGPFQILCVGKEDDVPGDVPSTMPMGHEQMKTQATQFIIVLHCLSKLL